MFNPFSKSLSKKEEEINGIIISSKIVAKIHDATREMIKPGMTGKKIEKKAKEIMELHGAISATYNYHGYPAFICISINEELVHGIPNDKELKKGDLVTIDVSLSKDGYYSDAAYTIVVEEYNNEIDKKLLQTTNKVLEIAIENAKPGVKLKDLGAIIESYVKQNGFDVSKDFVGHGIGTKLHEEPSVPNFYDSNNNHILEEGMVICIEPMIMIETNEIFIDPIDNWTARSVNGKNTSHSEHTILITKKGGKILTKI